jgi:hypothetical protein
LRILNTPGGIAPREAMPPGHESNRWRRAGDQAPLLLLVCTVSLFDTDLTPRTDLAALPARWICECWGTRPVNVTTPWRTCTWIADEFSPVVRVNARRTSRRIWLSDLARDDDDDDCDDDGDAAFIGGLCVGASFCMPPAVCASA